MFSNYIKIALKVLKRRKFFTFISLFGICFTLVVLNVSTALLDKIWSNDAPESQMGKMLISGELEVTGPKTRSNYYASLFILHTYIKKLESASNQSFFSSNRLITNFTHGKKLILNKRYVDANYWQLFDFNFIEGHPFNEQDYEKGERFAVISEFVRDQFYPNETAEGKTIEIDKVTFRIIGVVKSVSKAKDYTYSDVWIPTTSMNENFDSEYLADYRAVFLAESRDDFPAIRTEFQKKVKAIPMLDSNHDNLVFVLDTKFETVSRDFSGDINDSAVNTYIATIAGAAFLFMLLPAINLININTSRILERSSEIGVRKSFGASSGSLVLQFIVENIILTVIGGLIAFVLTEFVLIQITSMNLIEHTSFHLNFEVFANGLLISILFGLLSGVYPAWRMSRLNPVNALRGGQS
ncbi:MAG: ABC transporter permease [Calditrichaeota bacterium]|nr:ABC transporter permease [Calditrichota bacterium]